jgi:indolepyruvate ferredoxin oxidoreductase, alpha subunit
MDSQLCMGASIGMGLGLRHVLPDNEARRVVSVLGDSTFIHSGIRAWSKWCTIRRGPAMSC